jgi:hypothetical protein
MSLMDRMTILSLSRTKRAKRAKRAKLEESVFAVEIGLR